MENIEHYLSEVLEIPKESIAQCGAYYTTKKVKKRRVFASRR